MRKSVLLAGAMIFAAVLITSCSGDDNPTSPENHAPDQPTLDSPSGAPASGAINVSLTPVLSWIATDPDGDVLTYIVKFGAASPAPTVEEVSGTSYSPASLSYSTEYYWSITAQDPSGATTSSEEWTFTTLAAPVETITIPSTPTGPATGETQTGYTYITGGAVSNVGHTLQYRFDFGTGGFSSWGSASQATSWTAEAAYNVAVQARCVDHVDILSDWSTPYSVTIVDPVETVTTPGTPTGEATAVEGATIALTCAASTSSAGHTIQYRWDFDAGMSPWSSIRSPGHSWTYAGTYEVRVQARCAVDTDIESEWSAIKTVVITDPGAETVSAPNAPSGPTSGTLGVQYIITNEGGAVSNAAHTLEYRYDFADGQITNWFNNYTTYYHRWNEVGSYEVKMQARCLSHPTIESAWSEALVITISD